MEIDKIKITKEIGEIDLFICSSGFESRSTNLALSLDNDNVQLSVLFHLDETYNLSLKNAEVIKEKFKKIDIVKYPKNAPLATFDIFYFKLKSIKEKFSKPSIKVVIDISTFSREVLLILIKVISLDIFSVFEIKIVYTPNENYSNEDGKSLWLTKGVREIRSVLGYSGLHLPSKKLLLIILNGFEEERTEQIIECFEPKKLIIGKPSKKDSINPELNKIACEKFEDIKLKYNNILFEEFDFSCTDVKITEDILIQLVDKNEDYNIVISPLNNKISTVSVALVALKREFVQICYASANQYNIDANGTSSNYFLVFNLKELFSDNYDI